jgi:hypothetical protein
LEVKVIGRGCEGARARGYKDLLSVSTNLKGLLKNKFIVCWLSEVEASLLLTAPFDFAQGAYFLESVKLFLNDP